MYLADLGSAFEQAYLRTKLRNCNTTRLSLDSVRERHLALFLCLLVAKTLVRSTYAKGEDRQKRAALRNYNIENAPQPPLNM